MAKSPMNKAAGKNFKINDLIFKELLRRPHSLEGKNKVYNIADSKFWYLTPEQAQAFLDLEKKDKFQQSVVKKENDLLQSGFKEIFPMIAGKKLNIIDLGCGDGKKAKVLVEQFKDKSKLRYCPIDISHYMIEKAINTFSGSNLKKIPVHWNVSSFENIENISEMLRKSNFTTNLFLLLGGTIENSELHELLDEIRGAMRDSDCLVIGNKVTEVNPSVVVKYYNAAKYIDDLLFKTINQLGFDKKEVSYSSRFRGQRIEMFYTIKNARTIESSGRKIEFKQGDKIIVAYSYKYSQDALLGWLNLYFSFVQPLVSKDKSYILVLCKK
ncbi:L-histidine N(alpha)-methyltransferase [Candidatus Pacearchaeota archaeon]|nr:L-histidine N(alpha)-methyltransferase [Candidatus Pacearchaeota archaeon]